MPTKTTSNKPKSKRSNLQKARPKAPIPKKLSTGKYILIGLAVLVMLGGIVWWLSGKETLMDIQKSMENYLQQKYGKQFVVENYRVEGAGLGVEGDPTADAYPKDDASLRFEVWDRGNYKSDQHAYSDNYVEAVWGDEQTRVLATDISSIFGYEPTYRARIGFNGELDDYKALPSFGKAKAIRFDSISMGLSVTPNERIDESTKQLHAERILKLIELLKRSNINYLILTYSGDDSLIFWQNRQISRHQDLSLEWP